MKLHQKAWREEEKISQHGEYFTFIKWDSSLLAEIQWKK